jgi:Cu-Zn family superoxide dismutase
MRGTRRFGWLATVAVATTLVIGAGPARAASLYVEAGGRLTDFAPSAANATDGASAELWAVQTDGGSTYFLYVSDLDPAAEGTTYGVHIHVGPCVAGTGAAAGPHYNSDGSTPTRENEVWLDFTVLPGGYGYASAFVPFTIEPGNARSMVIHLEPTQDGGPTPGAAGGRQACLPVDF